MVAELAPVKKLGAYLGALRIFFNLALLAGPSTALYLISNSGFNSWFSVSAISGTLSLLLLATVKTAEHPIATEHIASSWNQITEALKVKTIYPVIFGIALLSTIYSAVISFSALHIEKAAPGTTAAAYFFLIFGAAGIAGALSAGVLSDRFERSRVVWPLMFVLGIGSVLFFFLPANPALVVICAIILGLGSQGSSLVFAAWLLDLAKPGLRATTISIQENTIDIFFAVGALTFGLAAQGPGLGSAFLIAGLATITAIYPLSRVAKKLSNN
jgi:predicted MFS family arabinose efflux permease